MDIGQVLELFGPLQNHFACGTLGMMVVLVVIYVNGNASGGSIIFVLVMSE